MFNLGVPGEDRIKLMKLTWDMIGSEFAGHQTYEKFYLVLHLL